MNVKKAVSGGGPVQNSTSDENCRRPLIQSVLAFLVG